MMLAAGSQCQCEQSGDVHACGSRERGTGVRERTRQRRSGEGAGALTLASARCDSRAG